MDARKIVAECAKLVPGMFVIMVRDKPETLAEYTYEGYQFFTVPSKVLTETKKRHSTVGCLGTDSEGRTHLGDSVLMMIPTDLRRRKSAEASQRYHNRLRGYVNAPMIPEHLKLKTIFTQERAEQAHDDRPGDF